MPKKRKKGRWRRKLPQPSTSSTTTTTPHPIHYARRKPGSRPQPQPIKEGEELYVDDYNFYNEIPDDSKKYNYKPKDEEDIEQYKYEDYANTIGNGIIDGFPLYIDDYTNNDDNRDKVPGWTYWNGESDQEAIANYDQNYHTGVNHYPALDDSMDFYDSVDFYEDKHYEYIDGDEMEDFKNYFKNHRNDNDRHAVLPYMENNFKVLDYDEYEYNEVGVINCMKVSNEKRRRQNYTSNFIFVEEDQPKVKRRL